MPDRLTDQWVGKWKECTEQEHAKARTHNSSREAQRCLQPKEISTLINTEFINKPMVQPLYAANSHAQTILRLTNENVVQSFIIGCWLNYYEIVIKNHITDFVHLSIFVCPKGSCPEERQKNLNWFGRFPRHDWPIFSSKIKDYEYGRMQAVLLALLS